MLPFCEATEATPLIPVRCETFESWKAEQPAQLQSWLEATAFEPKVGRVFLIPDATGTLDRVLACVDESMWVWSAIAHALPKGTYRVDASQGDADKMALGWGAASYVFDRYKTQSCPQGKRTLVWPSGAHREDVAIQLEGMFLCRDLINTPPNHMMPPHLAEAASSLAQRFSADCRVELVSPETFPMIHAVGRGSQHAPRLIDMTWGEEAHPQVTLVGKGVCFDAGGLDLKTADGMSLMKKDMGGGAHVLGLASMIMEHALPVRLRVLIPAVENRIGADAYRPSDVLKSRKGLSVEIVNTDAEGRLVVADALALACEDRPDLLIDFCTLTGGTSRSVLGTEIAPFFAEDETLASHIMEGARETWDPVLRLPLFTPYDELMESRIADVANCPSSSPGAAPILAALFLRRFVSKVPWVHFDISAWCDNPLGRSGRPKGITGGESQGMRATFHMLRRLYG